MDSKGYFKRGFCAKFFPQLQSPIFFYFRRFLVRFDFIGICQKVRSLGRGFLPFSYKVSLTPKNSKMGRQSKKLQMQGLRILRNEAYQQYVAKTKDEA
jgi:hypothetical protein